MYECKRERKRKNRLFLMSVYMCVKERDGNRVCTCKHVCVHKRRKTIVCVCLCVLERERVVVYVSVFQFVCADGVCDCVCMR